MGQEDIKQLFVSDVGDPFSTAKNHHRVTNAFADQIGFNPFGFPQFADYPGQEMLSNIDTLDRNLRWYFISNFRQTLAQAYVELGLVRVIVDVPVDDSYRGGFQLFSKQLKEDQIKRLQAHMRQRRDARKAKSAQKWTRLFGGGGLIINISDQDPEEPLEIDKIGPNSKVGFQAVDLWELFWDLNNTDAVNLSLEDPDIETFNFYGEKVHKSRVIKLKGDEIPSFVRPRFRGWGASVVEKMIRSMNRYLKEGDLIFEVLDEFKLDIFMIDGQKESLTTTEGEQLLQKRVQYANGRKNFQHATILDAKDEFQQRQLSFAGLSDVAKQTMIQVAADLRMPLTKIFGLSASGFNSGEDDIEVYNGMVESTIREDQEFLILRQAALRCQELFGFVPDDLTVELPPLRVLGADQEQTVKTGKAQILDAARARGDISAKEWREAVNRGRLMDVELDERIDQLEDEPEKDQLEEEESEPKTKITPAKGKHNAPDAPKPKDGKNENRIIEDENLNEFRESEHPRDSDGKFGEGSGSSDSESDTSKKKTKNILTP